MIYGLSGEYFSSTWSLQYEISEALKGLCTLQNRGMDILHAPLTSSPLPSTSSPPSGYWDTPFPPFFPPGERSETVESYLFHHRFWRGIKCPRLLTRGKEIHHGGGQQWKPCARCKESSWPFLGDRALTGTHQRFYLSPEHTLPVDKIAQIFTNSRSTEIVSRGCSQANFLSWTLPSGPRYEFMIVGHIYSHRVPSLNTCVLCFHNEMFETLHILVSQAHMTDLLGKNSKMTNELWCFPSKYLNLYVGSFLCFLRPADSWSSLNLKENYLP